MPEWEIDEHKAGFRSPGPDPIEAHRAHDGSVQGRPPDSGPRDRTPLRL